MSDHAFFELKIDSTKLALALGAKGFGLILAFQSQIRILGL